MPQRPAPQFNTIQSRERSPCQPGIGEDRLRETALLLKPPEPASGLHHVRSRPSPALTCQWGGEKLNGRRGTSRHLGNPGENPAGSTQMGYSQEGRSRTGYGTTKIKIISSEIKGIWNSLVTQNIFCYFSCVYGYHKWDTVFCSLVIPYLGPGYK